MFIFLKSAQKDGFLIPDTTHSEFKQIFPAYIGFDMLIAQLQMHLSSRRNILEQ
jgi:hypothetical protein